MQRSGQRKVNLIDQVRRLKKQIEKYHVQNFIRHGKRTLIHEREADYLEIFRNLNFEEKLFFTSRPLRRLNF